MGRNKPTDEVKAQPGGILSVIGEVTLNSGGQVVDLRVTSELLPAARLNRALGKLQEAQSDRAGGVLGKH